MGAARFSGQRILVTGASGFIGSHLCRRLLGYGAELHCVSRDDRRRSDAGRRWWCADLADTAAVREIVSAIQPDTVFHLASEVDGARGVQLVIPTLRSNLLSTVNVLTAMAERGCSSLVLAGSMEDAGAMESVATPCSPYAAAKWASAGYARMFHALYGLPAVVLRIFMVYGPGQVDIRKLIPHVTLALLRGEAPKLTSGRRPVDWIFVEDVVDGLIAASTAENVSGATLDIGTGALVTVREVAETLARIVNPSIAPIFGAIEDRPLETMRAADASATEMMVGWKPRTPLLEGLEKTVTWYRQRYFTPSPPTFANSSI
jgi:UDP-glucose 4-epimerase